VALVLLLSWVLPGEVLALWPGGIELPPASISGKSSLEELLQQRRSVRDYRDAAITLSDLGQLLWAAQGITHPQGLRSAPSAGALYPLELYVVAAKVDGLRAGVYHYRPREHNLVKTHSGDRRQALARAAFSQQWLRDAAVVVIFAANYQRTTGKYGGRGERYVHIEAGAAAQNLYLQAQALGLGTVVVGAFSDGAVAKVLELSGDLRAVILMPVGVK
jgi:SagB-type dehydrogenase family enzyme